MSRSQNPKPMSGLALVLVAGVFLLVLVGLGWWWGMERVRPEGGAAPAVELADPSEVAGRVGLAVVPRAGVGGVDED